MSHPQPFGARGTAAVRRQIVDAQADLLTAGADDILLCHDGGGDRAQTVAALAAVLPALRRRGLRFVAL